MHLRDVAYYGGVSQFLHIGATLDFEAQLAGEPDAEHGEKQAYDERQHVDVARVGGYDARGARLFHDAAVVGRGGEGDCVFLTFLQKREIEVGLYFLTAGDVGQGLLLTRGVADARTVTPGLKVEVAARCL